MTTLDAEAHDALAPVRDALLETARRDAEVTIDAARRAAAARIARARADVTALVEHARADGCAEAAEVVARDHARARREARAAVLAAQTWLQDEARTRARRAVEGLRDGPAYPLLLERLTAQARAALGDDADVHETPTGGVCASAGSRRLDLSLTALADRALDAMTEDAEQLWAEDTGRRWSP